MMYSRSSQYNPWRWKLFLTTLFIYSLFVGSFFLPYTSDVWKLLDVKSSYLMNSWIATSSFWQSFWAWANHPTADWIEDGVFLCFFLLYIFHGKGSSERIRRTSHLFIVTLVLAMVIGYGNKILFRDILYIPRESPSNVLNSLTILSDYITSIKVKCHSHSSFPSDHATTALIFVGYYCTVCDRKLYRILAVLYGLFLCLPRLVIGAHWMSDLLLGGVGIATLSLGILFYTPLHSGLERVITFLFSLKNKWKRA